MAWQQGIAYATSIESHAAGKRAALAYTPSLSRESFTVVRATMQDKTVKFGSDASLHWLVEPG